MGREAVSDKQGTLHREVPELRRAEDCHMVVDILLLVGPRLVELPPHPHPDDCDRAIRVPRLRVLRAGEGVQHTRYDLGLCSGPWGHERVPVGGRRGDRARQRDEVSHAYSARRRLVLQLQGLRQGLLLLPPRRAFALCTGGATTTAMLTERSARQTYLRLIHDVYGTPAGGPWEHQWEGLGGVCLLRPLV